MMSARQDQSLLLNHVLPRVPEAEAEVRCAHMAEGFGGRWLRRLGIRLRNPRPPRIELVWMPYYVFACGVRSRKGPSNINVSVDGWAGAFALCDLDEAVVAGDVVGEAFRPRMAAAEAAEIARRELQYAVMRQRSRGTKPVVEDAQYKMILHLPFWTYYYERRKNLLDIVVLDAYTGGKTGPKVKAALLEAFKKHTVT